MHRLYIVSVERDASAGETVNVGRIHPRMCAWIAADRPKALVVGKNVENVLRPRDWVDGHEFSLTKVGTRAIVRSNILGHPAFAKQLCA